MHDRLTNMYSFEVDGRLIILVPLSSMQIYDEQLNLKMGKMAKKRACISRKPSLLTKFF